MSLVAQIVDDAQTGITSLGSAIAGSASNELGSMLIRAAGIGSGQSLMKFGAGFVFNAEWDPVKENFGAAVPIFGTLATATIAMLIAVPVSFGIALFLTELSPGWLKRPLGIFRVALAGTNSPTKIASS